jgi:16S rRNA (cytosine967-C5)-methyltransferase
MEVRLAATRALDEVVRKGRSLSTVMPKWQARVAGRDCALLQELCYGVLRWYWRLDAIAKQLLRKPFKPKDSDVHCLIMLGLYQMQYLRVPDHAAVSATVAVTGALKKPWARGLVNAVLRGYQRMEAAQLEALERDPVVHYAHPYWLVQRLQTAYPQQWQTILEANNRYPPMCLRVNARRMTRADYKKALNAAGHEADETPDSPQGLVLATPAEVESLPGFSEGLVSVQDTAAQLAAGLLDAQAGERILDACAAPGGKTAHVLELQPRLAGMVALDHDANRLERVKQNLARLQLEANIVQGDAARPVDWWDEVPFDRILLDAPCSASGVIRRHPDIKLLRREGDIEPLIELQGRILRALWPLLKPGGMLLYVTCSILSEENVQQVSRFCAETADAEPAPITATWGEGQAIGRQILPGFGGMDGFYYAIMRKRG